MNQNNKNNDSNEILTEKELKSLKKAKYEEIAHNNDYKDMYLLKNIKTNQIVEIRAASSFHACKIIGWKPKSVNVISVTPAQ